MIDNKETPPVVNTDIEPMTPKERQRSKERELINSKTNYTKE